VSGRVNESEVLINVVINDKPKMLCCFGNKAAEGLKPKGTWPGAEVGKSSAADDAPPAKRHNPTHSDRDTERGKPVVSPSLNKGGKASRKVSL